MTIQGVEQWITIDGFNNYSISSLGNIKNNITSRILKPGADKNGYYQIVISDNNKKQYTKKIHRLVSFAFCNNDNNYNIVDHIDRNIINNNYLNLRWATPSMNSRNAKLRDDNTSGIKGVFHKINQNVWLAKWTEMDRTIKYKTFSIKKYGFDNAKERAIIERRIAEQLYGYL